MSHVFASQHTIFCMSKSLPGISSGARDHKLCASLHLRPYFVYMSSEGETADAQARLSLDYYATSYTLCMG